VAARHPGKARIERPRYLRSAEVADILLAFTQLACALICLRQLHRSTR
jgi:hypothetical protein